MSFPGFFFYDSLINKMKLIAREPCLYHLAIESIERFNAEFSFFPFGAERRFQKK